METRSFTKMHGLGNDFVVFDATTEPLSLSADQARLLADRRHGVGCDQILIVEPSPGDGVDFGYRIINADGSESGQCGNGARCIARFIREQGLSSSPSVVVRTISGDMVLEYLDGDLIRVDMGVPRFPPSEIPLDVEREQTHYIQNLADGEEIEFGAVSVGNPHAVLVVSDVNQTDVGVLGPAVQALPCFPEGVNVGFMQVCSRGRIALRVYERGAGETQACGSGACAAVAVGINQGSLNELVEVSLPGGILSIEWQGGESSLFMTGPATTVYGGQIAL